MAVTATPVFSQGVKSAQAYCTAAKTTYNDSTNAVLVFIAGANGSVIYGAKANPSGTVALTQCMLLSDASGTVRPIAFGAMTAYTLATTTAPTGTSLVDFGYSETAPRRCAPNEKIYAATAVANAAGVVFDVQYEDL